MALWITVFMSESCQQGKGSSSSLFLLSCPLSLSPCFRLVDFQFPALPRHSKWWSLSNRKDMLLVSLLPWTAMFVRDECNPSRSKELVGESSRTYWEDVKHWAHVQGEGRGRGQRRGKQLSGKAAQVWRALIRFPQALSLRLWQMFSNVTGRVNGRQ